jgi:hypothetical protein
VACATQKEVRGSSARQRRRNTEASSPAGEDDALSFGLQRKAWPWLVSMVAGGGAASARRWRG